MKILFTVFLTIFSLSSFAGDLYLVCEDTKNDDFLSSTLNNGRASLLLTTSSQEPVLLRVRTLKSLKTQYELTLKQVRINQSDKIELDLFEEVMVGNYTCLIRD